MITFNDLQIKYRSKGEIPYSELIQSKEWFDKRKTIVARDNYRCTACGKSNTVDHTFFNPTTGLFLSSVSRLGDAAFAHRGVRGETPLRKELLNIKTITSWGS